MEIRSTAADTDRPLDAATVAPRLPGVPDLRGVASSGGESCARVVARLQPAYGRAWAEIAAAYVWIAAGVLAVACVAARTDRGVGLAVAPLGGLWIGFGLHALVCFMHEAAHFNLHADKRTNDRLADWFVCTWVGEPIRFYRAVHWQHHLHLGEPGDTEVSYRRRLDGRFVIEALTGVNLARAVLRRRSASESGTLGPRRGPSTPLRAIAAHLLMLAVLGWAGGVELAATWGLGAFVAYPFCNSLRQLLEHRPIGSPDANRAVNRIFGDGLASRAFGAAGFNRHLLHHWCPSVSYTCFDELEAFFADTALASELASARTTYLAAARRLWARP